MRNAPSELSTGRQTHRKGAAPGGRREKGTRVYLEALESRQLLSVTLSFGGAGTALNLSESSPGTASVRILEHSATDLRIDLNGDTFGNTSTAAGGILTYETGTPATSTFADINITAANAITTLNALLTGDLVSIGTIADANGGVGNLNITGGLIQMLAPSKIDTSAATAGAGNVVLNATGTLKVQTGATIQTKDGSITLQGNTGGGNAGNFDGIDILGATVQTTGTGNILLQGTGSNDGTTGSHIGVNIADAAGTGAIVTATGTGSVTITGHGGGGTTGNFGVGIAGSVVNAIGGLSITGTGGLGTDSDIGVNIDGLSGTQITTPGLLQVTGTGGGTGGSTNETGVLVTKGALELAAGTGSIAITGTPGTANSTGLNITTASNVLAANGTLSLTADSMLLGSTPVISGSTVVIQPLTAGTQMDIGGVSSAGVLGLSALSVDGLLAGTLQIGNATTGAMVVSGTISSPSVLAMKLVNNGAITETGSITTAALAIQSAGPVTLAGANNIHVLAASVTGALTFNNSAALTIGTAGGLAGVSAGAGLTLTVAGLLTLGNGAGESISTPGLADINSAGVSEGNGSIVTATSLRLQGTGSFALGYSNTVGTLAANIVGALQFVDSGNMVVGVAGASSGIQSGGGDVSLTSGGNLTVTAAVQAGSGTVTLDAMGTISSPGVAVGITAGSLGVAVATNLGTAGVPFTMAVANFAGIISGNVSITNAGALAIATVGSLNGVRAALDVSILTSGALVVSQQITAGKNVVLAGSGAIAVLAAINGTSATVLGSGGADNIVISATGTAPLSLDGRGGIDSYTINFGQLQSQISVAPSSGTNTLTANGTVGSDTFGIASGIMVWNGAEFVGFSNIQQVFLLGGTGNDTFNVAPIAGTAINAVGGQPDATTTGDWLNMVFMGTTGVMSSDAVSATGHSGSFAFTNRQPVVYSDMEIVPTLNVGSGSALAITVVEGKSTGTVSLASFADPEGLLPASSYTATVDWGDGSGPLPSTSITYNASKGAFTLTGSHTFTTPGVYIPSIVITSPTGLSTGTIHETVTVSAIPIVGTGKTLSGTEGKTISGIWATFTTTRTTAAASNYTARINWGDGTTTAGSVVKDSTGHFHVNGSHAYGDQSTAAGFHVTVTISRTGASNTVIASTAKVAGVPIGSTTSRSLTGHVNVLTSYVLGTFKDQNAVNTNPAAYAGTVSWGDGTSSAVTFVRLSSSASGSVWQVRATHKYTSKKTFVPVVKLHDVANAKQVLTINDTLKIS